MLANLIILLYITNETNFKPVVLHLSILVTQTYYSHDWIKIITIKFLILLQFNFVYDGF